MKKIITKIHQLTLEACTLAVEKKYNDLTEEDVDKIGEIADMLNDLYENLFDEVFESTLEE